MSHQERPPDSEKLPENPQDALDHIRSKMERTAEDFAEGRINRAQFNAIYAHYNDQRVIIERLIQRNPDNDAWKHVAAPGHTTFLRSHFKAQAVFYIVFRHRDPKPLIHDGTEPTSAREQVGKMLRALWLMEKIPRSGLARKSMGDGQWMVVAVGEFALTIVVYSLQPSNEQNTFVRDLHSDFERANRLSLQRGLNPGKMVFPHRALSV